MRNLLALLVVASFFCSPANAARSGNSYFGLQYAMTEVDVDVSGLDAFEPTALVLKSGGQVNPNTSIEFRFGLGLEDDNQSVGRFDVDFEIDRILGIYGVFHTSGGGPTSFYGLLGYSWAEGEISVNGSGDSEDEDGISYGVGVNFSGFNAEYMVYLDEDDVEVTALSLGYTFYY